MHMEAMLCIGERVCMCVNKCEFVDVCSSMVLTPPMLAAAVVVFVGADCWMMLVVGWCWLILVGYECQCYSSLCLLFTCFLFVLP